MMVALPPDNYVKLPIFVARQWIRHRTANVNEYSARYSVVKDRFYHPTLGNIRALGEPAVTSALWHSVVLSAVTALAGAVLGAILAYAVSTASPTGVLKRFVTSLCGVLAQFGGVILAMMDTAAAVSAIRHAGASCVTVSLSLLPAQTSAPTRSAAIVACFRSFILMMRSARRWRHWIACMATSPRKPCVPRWNWRRGRVAGWTPVTSLQRARWRSRRWRSRRATTTC